MRPFRFRAASALDLRKKHEDDARQALARAQNAAAVADAALAADRQRVAEAAGQLAQVQSLGAQAWLIGWHRSWILKQARDADASRRQAAAAASAVGAASDVVREAYKTRRVLERLRDRLAARHARETERQDLNQMNELAGMRYLAAAGERREQQ